jgi:hypothetical protein
VSVAPGADTLTAEAAAAMAAAMGCYLVVRRAPAGSGVGRLAASARREWADDALDEAYAVQRQLSIRR